AKIPCPGDMEGVISTRGLNLAPFHTLRSRFPSVAAAAARFQAPASVLHAFGGKPRFFEPARRFRPTELDLSRRRRRRSPTYLGVEITTMKN
ncbi:hypothetical protein BHM03_00000802, partial [Ensete ventricosum]